MHPVICDQKHPRPPWQVVWMIGSQSVVLESNHPKFISKTKCKQGREGQRKVEEFYLHFFFVFLHWFWSGLRSVDSGFAQLCCLWTWSGFLSAFVVFCLCPLIISSSAQVTHRVQSWFRTSSQAWGAVSGCGCGGGWLRRTSCHILSTAGLRQCCQVETRGMKCQQLCCQWRESDGAPLRQTSD